MKLKAEQFGGLLKAPPAGLRAVLLFGPDLGQVRERAAALVKAVAGDLTDPFRVAELGPEALAGDPARLSDEARALSLTGGRRVVRVRDAGNSLADLMESVLDDPVAPGGLIVLEAGDLAARDRLVKLCEGHAAAAAVRCFPDEEQDLGLLVLNALKARRLEIEPAALEFVVERLGADRLASRSEVEKLALYKGEGGGRVVLADAEAILGDVAPLALDDVVAAAASGDQASLDRVLPKCLAAKQSPVSILRAMQRHLQRLHLAAALVGRGQPPDQALKALRPPVFYKQQAAFRAQLRQWTSARAAQALDLLTQAELDCKSTDMPSEAICARALMRIAQAARAGLNR
jgi:DNA polymerase-3 subunit delta